VSSPFVFANNVLTTLANNLPAGNTTITLASTTNFPNIPPGSVWAITLNDAATQQVFEICYVTAISGANLTVLRGQEGTATRSWLVGDYVFSTVTAGVLGSFSQGPGGSFVQLSPAAQQTGYINISGAVTAAGAGNFVGVNVGGALSNATTGNFSGDVSAEDFNATRAYAATSLASLGLRFNGGGGIIGVGPSSSLIAEGITASALAIGLSGATQFVVFDTSGNIGTGSGVYAGLVSAATILGTTIEQNGVQVLNGLTSNGNTLALTNNGATYNLESKGSAQIFNQNGSLLSVTPKMVLGTVSIPNGTTSTAVNLSGNAIFSGSGTYYVFVSPYQTSLPSNAVSYFINNNSASEFTIINGSISTTVNLAWVAIGY
jgi:hypothetical protein